MEDWLGYVSRLGLERPLPDCGRLLGAARPCPSTGAPIPPLLHIEFASMTQVRVWWPSPSTGFGLQSNSNLSNPAAWLSYGGAVNDDGIRRSVLFPISSAPIFFKLRSPP